MIAVAAKADSGAGQVADCASGLCFQLCAQRQTFFKRIRPFLHRGQSHSVSSHQFQTMRRLSCSVETNSLKSVKRNQKLHLLLSASNS